MAYTSCITRGRSPLLLAGSIGVLCFLIFLAMLIHRPALPKDAIAFGYQHDGLSGIYAIWPDGSHLTQIALTRRAPTWVVDAWRDAPLRFAPHNPAFLEARMVHSPHWSSQGQKINYLSRVSGAGCDQVFSVDVGEREPVRVACLSREIPKTWMDWSPGDGTLAFVTRKNQINQLNLLNNQGVLNQQTIQGTMVWGIAWSPDSTRVAATVADHASLQIYHQDGIWSYFSMEAQAYGKPTWSPDGQRLGFLCYFEERIDICSLNADGTGFQRIAFPRTFPYLKDGLEWSPDGSLLLFQAVQPSGYSDLFLMRADGSDLRQLTFDWAGDSDADWSPDGSRITFVSTRDGNRELYSIEPDGTGLMRLTYSPGDEYDPTWRRGLR